MSFRQLLDNFRPSNYHIKLDLTKAHERIFSGEVTITGKPKKQRIFLHQKDLNISQIKYNDIIIDFKSYPNDEIELLYDFAPDSTINLNVSFSGMITDAMHGLYPCYYKENGKNRELFATQFESHHAREVFPCVDEPAAKATFELELIASKKLQFISNTPIIAFDKQGDWAIAKFDKTPVMSTYLLAFVVGDLHKKTAFTKSGVEVSVWATHAQNSDMLDFPLSIATEVLDFYEEYFDERFPLTKCDHVALPDFSSGAMENWGLITYREMALLANEKSALSSKRYVAIVIAHETAHQWFGNLVTMKWWDDLWLNESFATMMEYFAIDHIKPDWHIWEEFAVSEAIVSLRRDAIDGVQAVHVPVHHPDEINTLFDGAIVYAKGARLMNMLRNYIGDEAFQKGLQDYFKKFKYQNTVGDDLWQCLEKSSQKPVGEFMKAWIHQSGFPTVSIKCTHNNHLELEQNQFFIGEGKNQNKLWPIFLSSNQESLPKIMDQHQIKSVKNNSTPRFNIGNVSHFIPNYSPDIFAELLQNVSSFDTISRLQLLQERSLLARGGKISSAELLKTIRFYKNEKNLAVWDMINIIIGDLKMFITPDTPLAQKMKKLVGELAEYNYIRLGFDESRDDTEEDIQLRPSILAHTLYSEKADSIQRALEIFTENREDLSKISPEIRSLVLANKIRHDESPDLIQDLLSLYQQTTNVDFRDDILVALASTKSQKTGSLLLEKIKDSNIVRPQDIVSWFVHLLRNHYTREQTWQWLLLNWSWIEKTFDGDKSYNDFPRYAGSILRSQKHLEEFKEFFMPRANDPSLTRAIEMGIRDIEAKINLIARDQSEVEKELAKI